MRILNCALRPHVNLENTIASLRERLEALSPRNRGETLSNVDETNLLIRTDLTNLLFLHLLKK